MPALSPTCRHLPDLVPAPTLFRLLRCRHSAPVPASLVWECRHSALTGAGTTSTAPSSVPALFTSGGNRTRDHLKSDRGSYPLGHGGAYDVAVRDSTFRHGVRGSVGRGGMQVGLGEFVERKPGGVVWISRAPQLNRYSRQDME